MPTASWRARSTSASKAAPASSTMHATHARASTPIAELIRPTTANWPNRSVIQPRATVAPKSRTTTATAPSESGR